MRVALIGAGVIGNVHARVLSNMDVEISAICDVIEERAEKLAELYAPEAKIYTDYEKLLDEIKPDAVHICTPHYLHASETISALGRGINVLCEKPLCAHPEELASVLEAEKSSSAVLGVCHQNRYNATTSFVRELINKKRIVAAHGSVCWHRDEKYYTDSPWRGKLAEAGGGSLINQALHTLDLLQMFAQMPKSVTARIDSLVPRRGVEVEDTVTAVFEEDNGEKYTFFSTNNVEKNLPIELMLKLDDGDEIVMFPKSVLVNGKTVFEADTEFTVAGKSYYGGGHASLFADYYDCLKAGRKFSIDGNEASKVMKLIFAVYRSNGKKITI